MTSEVVRSRHVAALLTCFNRRDKTVTCIQALHRSFPAGSDLTIFVTDDASTDGTAAAVRCLFPDTNILDGTGDLYWCRGMELAWRAALSGAFDGYLWLNDDVELDDDAATRILGVVDSSRRAGPWPVIIVGSVADPLTGETSYGGQRQISRWHPGKLRRIDPDPDRVQLVDTFNGNVVYVPSEVVERIGIIDPIFSHATGDTDYGLRARRAGIPIVLAPGYYGTCARNPPIEHTLRTFLGRKGLPWRDWLVFTRRHALPGTWPLAFMGPYARAMLTRLRQALHLMVSGRRESERGRSIDA